MRITNVKLLTSQTGLSVHCFSITFIISLGRHFSKFYLRHYEFISKLIVGLKFLLHHGLSEPEFYGDFVYKVKKFIGMTDFSDQFRKIIMGHKRIGYDLNVMRQFVFLSYLLNYG